MKLRELYEFAVKEGINQDPRGKDKVSLYLDKQRQKFNKLSSSQKETFDKERLTNPYADTRILNGTPERIVKKILVGIDIDTSELLLADRLRRDRRLDCVLSHHPQGYAWASFYEVMDMQVDLLVGLGISSEVAKSVVGERIKEVERKVLPANHQRAVDTARLLDLPFLCIHTPADNFVMSHLQNIFDTEKPKKLGNILEILKSIPEYKISAQQGSPPKILIGKPKKRVGKIAVEMTGGTEGPKDIFGRISQAGVSTIVCMHVSEEHFKKVNTEHINIIVAGHISSDNLGMNLLLDKIEKQFRKLDIVSCSGFRRIRHQKI